MRSLCLLAVLLILNPAFAKPAKKAEPKKTAPVEAPAPVETPAPEPEPVTAAEPASDRMGSEFLYQARGGALELTPYTAFTAFKYHAKATDVDVTQSRFLLGGAIEYGISDMFSLAASIGTGVGTDSYENCTGCDSETAKGVTDPSLVAGVRIPMGAAAIRADLDYSISLEDHEIEANNDFNLATGGSSLDINVGLEFSAAGKHFFGGRISKNLMSEDQTVNDKGIPEKYKVEPGDEISFSGFYEFHLRKLTIGGALIITKQSNSKTKDSSGTTENIDGYDSVGIQAYVPVYLNDRITLLPTLLSEVRDYKTNTVDEATYAAIAFGARFTF